MRYQLFFYCHCKLGQCRLTLQAVAVIELDVKSQIIGKCFKLQLNATKSQSSLKKQLPSYAKYRLFSKILQRSLFFDLGLVNAIFRERGFKGRSLNKILGHVTYSGVINAQCS